MSSGVPNEATMLKCARSPSRCRNRNGTTISAALPGFDVAVIEEGRIRQVYGFLDKVPG
jgi:hypothetical protein